jgi:alpha-tubulin suppressor-like RCC1 family protein
MRRPEQQGRARPYHGAMTYVTSGLRARIAVVIVSVLGWLAGCSDVNGPDRSHPQRLIVSDPASAPGAPSGPASPALMITSSVGEPIVYVSIPPGTAPSGSTATIQRAGGTPSFTTPLSQGGLDPVPLAAQTGDSIEVAVRDAAGNTIQVFGMAVKARRPPVVVRTDPPHRKTDVPVNTAIIVVFSEPVAGGTLTSSPVRLWRGANQIASSVRLLEGTATAAVLVPAAPLEVNTEYRLDVTPAVRDLDGDALPATEAVVFTTGHSSTGPAASIELSPLAIDVIYPFSVWMFAATYQLTATVRDAAGNQLIDQPVVWSVSDSQALAVSANGLLTARGPVGVYAVTAAVNGLSRTATVIVPAGPAASVEVTPTPATVGAAGDTIHVTATVRDALGRLLDNPSVTWTSSAPLVATVDADSSGRAGKAFATVTGVGPGSVLITATSEAASASASVTVTQPVPVASVTITPAAVTVLPQQTVQLSATVRDANNRILAGRTVAWTTDNASVATVDAKGLVTGVGAGSAAVTATSGGKSDTASITVTVLTFASVSPGTYHTCGLTTVGTAWCWGDNHNGQLGNGTFTTANVCDLPGSLPRPCSSSPIAVSGGYTFNTLDAGTFHTCALATSGAAFCWGNNFSSQLGDGTTTDQPAPVAVLGGLTLATVSAGLTHTCGVATGGAIYCWGPQPAEVSGELSFVEVSAGGSVWCGVTATAEAYCRGSQGPAAVPGGLSFVHVSDGGYHTCGITTGGAAYCWGVGNVYGELGDGTTASHSSPALVIGGLTFITVSSGIYHTCGITTGGAAYCWGRNEFGQLGDGTTTGRLAPVAVLGGLTFATVDAQIYHTCGVTTSGVAYCWGYNAVGQLGNGTTTDSNVPVRVLGQP